MSVLSDPIGEVKDGAVGSVVGCSDVDAVGPVVGFSYVDAVGPVLAFFDADPCAAVAFLFHTIGSSTTPVSTGNGSCDTGEVSPTPDWNLTVEAIKALARKCMHICCKAPFIRVFCGRRFTTFFHILITSLNLSHYRITIQYNFSKFFRVEWSIVVDAVVHKPDLELLRGPFFILRK